MRSAQADPSRRYDLSERQREVLNLIVRGRTNPEIAQELGITLDGVKYHVREILGRLGVTSREEAAELWSRSTSLQSRARRLWAGLPAPLLAHPAISFAAVGLLAAVMAAVAIALATGDGDGRGSKADAATPGNTNIPAGGLTPAIETPSAPPIAGGSATSTPADSVAPAACSMEQQALVLELVPDGPGVLIRLAGAPGSVCRLEGSAALRVIAPPSDPRGIWSPFANVSRDFALALDLPLAANLKMWRWSNWCGEGSPGFNWLVQVLDQGRALQASATRNADLVPGCRDEREPTIVEPVSAAPGVSDDLPPVPDCTTSIPGWLCEFAARVEAIVPKGRQGQQYSQGLGEVISGLGVTSYTCGPGGTVIGYEYSDLCRDKGEGEVWNGYPLTLHGSEGGPISREALIDRLVPLLVRPAARGGSLPVATVGCLVDDPGCHTFILAFATETQPAVAYLVFRLWPGSEPAVIGAGLSGDNAATILGGGVITTGLGETRFAPFRR